MRLLAPLLLISLFSVYSHAETAPTTNLSSSACPGGISNVTLYRCVCRLDVPKVGGGFVSFPLMMNGQNVIYSRTELSGSCQGTIAANTCNPAVLNGANAMGTYSCISVTTTDTGVTLN